MLERKVIVSHETNLEESTEFEVPISLVLKVIVGNRVSEPVHQGNGHELEDVVARIPFIVTDYSDRTGYDTGFLGIDLPLPTVDRAIVATMFDGEHVIPYEHFSVVMHERRKLALFTASNVDGSDEARRPEPGRDYSRKGLGETGGSSETWIIDPRLTDSAQLTDNFYNRDRRAFDKGHLVRREDVCWGSSYDQIKKANGDTFHIPNCSPQVSHFNQSQQDGIWGELENFVLAAVKKNKGKYSIFAGPVLDKNDTVFEGWSPSGTIRVQIPNEYWKIIACNTDQGLQAFAFVLRQSLKYVQWSVTADFSPTAEWQPYLISVSDLENKLDGLSFPDSLKSADGFAGDIATSIVSNTKTTRYQ